MNDSTYISGRESVFSTDPAVWQALSGDAKPTPKRQDDVLTHITRSVVDGALKLLPVDVGETTKAAAADWIAGAAKAAPLFAGRAKWLYGATAVLYGSAEMKWGDSIGNMAVDGALGAVKGVALKGTMDLLGIGESRLNLASRSFMGLSGHHWAAPAKGILLSGSSILFDTALSRDSYRDPMGNYLGLEHGLGKALSAVGNFENLMTGAITFSLGAAGMTALASKPIASAVPGLAGSKLFLNTATGFSYGAFSGMAEEARLQREKGSFNAWEINKFDWQEIGKQGLFQATSDAAGAAVGHQAGTAVRRMEHNKRVSEAQVHDGAGKLDITGRPLSDGNVGKINALFKPLTEPELQAARRRTEMDLADYQSSNGSSVLERLRQAGMNSAQYNRVMDVFSAARHYLLSREGPQAAEQRDTYVHMIGELSEGLDSVRRNHLTPRQTQNAILAQTITDLAKWSGRDGNFFVHHLDGAVAADLLLRPQIGSGFGETDLRHVRHAIMEHQIGPPNIMALFYTNKIKAGLEADGLATKHNLQVAESIKQKMENPFKAPLEADSQGGRRIKYTGEEREFLRRYVGEGTQNWHVPHADNPWDPVSRVVISADSLDNYFPDFDQHGMPIKGPFKIAALEPPDGPSKLVTIDSLANRLYANAASTLENGLIAPGDRPRAKSRLAEAPRFYEWVKADIGNWLRGAPKADGTLHAGTSLADVPYWSTALTIAENAPAAHPDLVRAKQMHERFVQHLQRVRRFDSAVQTDFSL
jgi:hypothetical protein